MVPFQADATLQPGATLTVPLPEAHNAFAYVFDGTDVRLGAELLRRGALAVLSHGDRVELSAGDTAARVLLVAGKPLNEPVAKYGPFVMNTREQIHEAIADLQAGRS